VNTVTVSFNIITGQTT